MSFREEYQKLLLLLEKSQTLQGFSLEEILSEAVLFFEELRKSFPTAPPEERQEMVEMMNQLQQKLQEVSAEASASSGMNEQEFFAYSENPSNFSPEQWNLVQETRRRLYDSARKFSESLGHEKKAQAPDSESHKKQPRPIRGATKRSRRSEWKKT